MTWFWRCRWLYAARTHHIGHRIHRPIRHLSGHTTHAAGWHAITVKVTAVLVCVAVPGVVWWAVPPAPVPQDYRPVPMGYDVPPVAAGTPQDVPEPGSAVILATGAAFLFARRKRE